MYTLFWLAYIDMYILMCFFFKQKTAYEMRISDWSSDVCSSVLKSNTLRETATFEPATVGCIAKYPPGEFVIDGDRRREALISPPRIVHEQLDRQRKGRHRREGCRINQSRRENARVIALLVDCISSAKRQPQTVGNRDPDRESCRERVCQYV